MKRGADGLAGVRSDRQEPPTSVRNDSALILFTLAPRSEGRRRALGPESRTTALFTALLDHLESTCADLPGVDFFVASAGRPPARRGYPLPQRGKSFGESLRLALDEVFALGYRRVVVIGNDAPEISRDYLQQAFGALEAPGRAVIGPSRDGGYALLGLTRPCPDVFRSMPWGSSRVARTTCQRLAAAGFRVAQLATLEDLDDRRALDRFVRRARRTGLAGLALLIRRLLRPPLPTIARRERPPVRLDAFSGTHLRAPPACR